MCWVRHRNKQTNKQTKMPNFSLSLALRIFDKSAMGVSDCPAVEAKVVDNGSEGHKKIEVNMYERKGDEFVPFRLLFEYNPSQGYAPIHEVMEGRNKRIKGGNSSLYSVSAFFRFNCNL